MTIQKWGGLASYLLAAAFIIAPLIYLVGDLRNALGPFAYSLADFLYGPVWAAGLITMVVALREQFNGRAPRRSLLALSAAILAAGAMVLVACIRTANRQYHLLHPGLHLETSDTVLVVWATLVSGVTGAGYHFLGWTLVLLSSAGWTSGRIPCALSVLYMVGGIAALFVYAMHPNLEGFAAGLGVIWGVWQGTVLWKSRVGETQSSENS